MLIKTIDFSYQFKNSFSDSRNIKRDTVNIEKGLRLLITKNSVNRF